MARTDNLNNFLTDVADAIRDKKGTTEPINASDFDTEIASIEGGGGTTKEFTGHYDTEGLKQIGWTDEEIQYYQDNGVQWNEESDDIFKLTATELAGDDSKTTRFLPKNSARTNFQNYYSLIAIPLINNIINCADMFNACRSLKAIPQLDTTNVTSMSSMFNACNSLKNIPQLDTTNVTNMQFIFGNCYSLNSIPQLDTTNVTNMSSMFNSCYALKTIPQLNTSKVTSMSNMFYACNSLNSIPQLDTSNVTNMSSMFTYCYALKTIPQLNTSKVTSMSGMFNNCNSLNSIPQLDTTNVTSMSSMFSNCSSLKTIPQLNTSKVTNFTSAFTGCSMLTTIPLLDFGSATSISTIFQNTSSLITLGGFKDLGKAYLTSRATNYYSYTLDLSLNNSLTHDSLMNVINNLYDIANKGVKPQQLVLGSTNLAKLTEEEIAIATNKGWTVS